MSQRVGHDRKSLFLFYNELGKKYPEEDFVYSDLDALFRERVLSDLIPFDGMVLDIGCNRGRFSRYVGGGYVGLEPSIDCLRAFNRARIRGIGEELPFRDGSFEMILLLETLEHIPERKIVLSECKRVLKEGGKMIVSVPYGSNPWEEIHEPILERFGIERRLYLHGSFNEGTFKDLLEGWNIKRMQIIRFWSVSNPEEMTAINIYALVGKT